MAPARPILALMVSVVLSLGAGAQDNDETAQRLQDIEASLAEAAASRAALGEEAGAIADELDILRVRLLASEHEIRDLEQSLTTIQETLAALAVEMEEREQELTVRRDEFATVLAALQRLALQPTDMMIAMPGSPTETQRTAMLLASVTRGLEQRMTEIETAVRSLVELRDDMTQQEIERERTLVLIRAKLAIARYTVASKSDLLSRIEQDDAVLAGRQNELSREAADLKDLLLVLWTEAEQQSLAQSEEMAAAMDALAANRFSAQQGRLPLPVTGQIALTFREIVPEGLPSRGIAIESAPGARIITPYDGQLAFAGTFRDYGHLLIIDHGEGYHTVLAGFARVHVTLGQWLLAGEPVGVMPTNEADGRLLYVELRRNGDPINPLPWIAAGTSEVSGG
ncbi:MAG: hypothetical protein CMM46_14565 [Rhodospirillaceae bacterium]|nr:hypothetical protein [Rhodospirillaceae bacterium]|tara:strand:+ start:13631 stop:14824 length:1194 start_codon:yes stop_codon:yes gene_type:complete